jgi:4-alpha-glucanotransferase
MNKRGSGILLHITSLPSPFGIGDLGPDAYRFVDFLSEASQSYWQILPLTPTLTVFGNSPYSSPSAFAGNPLLISPQVLTEWGLLSGSDIETAPSSPNGRVDYEVVTKYKSRLFTLAYENFRRKGELSEFERFCQENSFWLEDYALFVVLKGQFKSSWNNWSEDIRDRKPGVVRELNDKFKHRIGMEKFLQYIFYKQWFYLKSYSNNKGIQIIGDIPIYVSFDSAEVWANPEIFKLDEKKKPTFVAGVPPDYFSKSGQRWGNPVYRWDVLKDQGYSWWIKRMEHSLTLFDAVRLDHFRGFVAYWEVPAEEKTAINGKWVEAPAVDFFDILTRHFSRLPIIAEDLGYITPDVKEVMDRYGFPGMKLLIFAFGDDFPKGSYLPHNHEKRNVVYTGTHDNNTIKGWFRTEATPEDKARFFRYIGREIDEEEIHWEFIRLAMMSVADYCIIPMQDLLGLGQEARMNLPATSKGNWGWRLQPGQLTADLEGKLKEMTETYGRG